MSLLDSCTCIICPGGLNFTEKMRRRVNNAMHECARARGAWRVLITMHCAAASHRALSSIVAVTLIAALMKRKLRKDSSAHNDNHVIVCHL